MRIEELYYDKREAEILAKPVPWEFSEMNYFKKLRYAKNIYDKQKIIKDRCLNSKKAEFDREICLNTPGMDMEYFRCINLELMEHWITTSKDKVLTVNVTGKVNCVFVRVGCEMQKLLNKHGVTLKIVNIEGRVDTLNPVVPTQIYYFKIHRD